MVIHSLLGYAIEKKLTISHSTDIAEEKAGANLDRVELSKYDVHTLCGNFLFCYYTCWN